MVLYLSILYCLWLNYWVAFGNNALEIRCSKLAIETLEEGVKYVQN